MRRYLRGAPELRVQTKITRPFISSALFLAVLDLAMLPLQLETAVSVVLDKSNAETGTGVVMVRPGKAVAMVQWSDWNIRSERRGCSLASCDYGARIGRTCWVGVLWL